MKSRKPGWARRRYGRGDDAHPLTYLAAGFDRLERMDAAATDKALAIVALSGYAAAALLPIWAGRFRGMSESTVNRVMSWFAFRSCVVNRRYARY